MSTKLFTITPHDTNALAVPTSAIFVGGAGNITLQGLAKNSNNVVIAVTAGSKIAVRAKFIRAAGTTATGLVGEA